MAETGATRKKALVTGAAGFIGRHLCALLGERHEVTCAVLSREPDHDENVIVLDVTNADAVRHVVHRVRPEVIVHLAGNKSLNYCESHPEAAYAVNYHSTQYLADQALEVNARCVFISSDYVFDGTSGNYKEIDRPNPRTIYGETKALSEDYIMRACPHFVILRTSAVYGRGGVFFSWLVESLSRNQSVDGFADTYFTPTYVGDVVWALSHIIEHDLEGIFHVAGRTVTSRYEMAREIALSLKVDPELVKPASVRGSGLLIAQDSSLNCDQTSTLLRRQFLSLSQGLERFFSKDGGPGS